MSELKQAIMNLVPADGSAIGNRALLEQLQQQGHDIEQAAYLWQNTVLLPAIHKD